MASAHRSGKVFLTFLSVPRVAASFWRPAGGDEIKKWKKNGLETAEIRMDLADIKNTEDAKKLIAGYSSLPVILTIRAANEGGGWKQNETARLDLFLHLLQHPAVAAADIELAADIRAEVLAAAKKLGKAVIFSRHNFSAGKTLSSAWSLAQTQR
ncbi:MAG: type I 3-dehydroquinate dehydratase, partial [Betaproteobacteria bacterium]|nr:type I 3-dehydroquinate dehydratase [Betaproteobacteria bacterium]